MTTGYWGEALRASERQSWRQFGRAPVGLMLAGLTADRGCVCVAANETYCELTGYSRGEMGGTNFLSFFHPEDQPALEVLIEDVISGATDQIAADARLVRKDGEIVWVRLTGSVIRPPAGERYLATFIEDIYRCPSRRGPRYSGWSANCSGRADWRAWDSSSAESRMTSATRSR